MRPSHSRLVGVLGLTVLLAACAHSNGWIADRLFCGRGIPGGGTVTDVEWATFLAEVVTPRFPDGLTVWRAEGQWRDAAGAVQHEPVMVLEILHHGDPAARASIEAIAREYRRRFRQEAVLRVTVPARAVFVTE
ncbi:MAG: hypothetical protein QOH21_2341 [Acidobacteriota bacterium]|nr:hypothetical protein [Acidobacteriota bacterium]